MRRVLHVLLMTLLLLAMSGNATARVHVPHCPHLHDTAPEASERHDSSGPHAGHDRPSHGHAHGTHHHDHEQVRDSAAPDRSAAASHLHSEEEDCRAGCVLACALGSAPSIVPPGASLHQRAIDATPWLNAADALPPSRASGPYRPPRPDTSV